MGQFFYFQRKKDEHQAINRAIVCRNTYQFDRYPVCAKSWPSSCINRCPYAFSVYLDRILIEAVDLKRMPSRKKLLSVFLLWIGTLLAAGIGSKGFIWKDNFEGIMYGLFSAITFAFFIFFSGKVAKGVPAIQRSTVISAVGLAFVLTIISPTFIMNGTLVSGLWKYGIMLGLFGLVIPVVFFAIGTPKIDSGSAMIAGAAELPAAIVAAMLILGEKITFVQALGIILIMIGMAIPQMYFPSSRIRRSFQRG